MLLVFYSSSFVVQKLVSTPGTRSTGRFHSSYVGSLARRVRDSDGLSDAAYLKELNHRNDPEAVIRLFENQPSLHTNPSALGEYVKALVKVDRLDDAELLKTLHRGKINSRFVHGLYTLFHNLPTLEELQQESMHARFPTLKFFFCNDF